MSSLVAPVEFHRASSVRRIVLIGNPNTGKTTLFNDLCGARARTSNYPGTTTSVRTGNTVGINDQSVAVLDLPGVYDLDLDAPESRIAREVLTGSPVEARSAKAGTQHQDTDAVVVIVDACNLSRNLVLVGQLLGRVQRLVVALNMSDLATRYGIQIDTATLSRRLGVPVVKTVARTGMGIVELRSACLHARPHATTPATLPPVGIEPLAAWGAQIAEAVTSSPEGVHEDRLTERVDRWLTHPVTGVAAFVAIMGGLFWILFALATIPMDLIEAIFARLGDLVNAALPAGAMRDLLAEGVVGGIAGTVVFLPQICLLFFLITLLEDTGYLARAAFVMDRALSRFGLPGQAFVPLLTSHACALPGIMSTRLIPDTRDRLATILVAPFMSCSARLPVYVLLTTMLFEGRPAAAGLAFAGCYMLGGVAALFTAKLFGATLLKGPPRPMILELPTYKTPSLKNAVLTSIEQGRSFLTTAGTVIVAICIVMWWLSAYPRATSPTGEPLEGRAAQSASFAGQIGRGVQPAFEPLGFDWQLTMGVATSFLAREVFVSTMSVLAGGGDETDVDEGVVDRIRGMTRDDGTPVFTLAASASALVFFVLAMQCLPTLSVTRKETGSIKYAALQLFYMSGLAYVVALVVYQGLRAAGVS